MPDNLFITYSKNVVDFVFLHEVGHLALNTLLKIISFIILYFLLTSFISSFIFTLMIFFTKVLHIKSNYYYMNFHNFIKLTSSLGLLTMFVSWISELQADLYAIKKIGKQKYLQVLAEMKEKANPTLGRTLLRRFLYPPQRLVWFFAKKYSRETP